MENWSARTFHAAIMASAYTVFITGWLAFAVANWTLLYFHPRLGVSASHALADVGRDNLRHHHWIHGEGEIQSLALSGYSRYGTERYGFNEVEAGKRRCEGASKLLNPYVRPELVEGQCSANSG